MFSQYLRTCYLRNRNKAGKARPVAPAKVNNGKSNNNEALTFPATPPVELGQVLRVMPAVSTLVAPAAAAASQPGQNPPPSPNKKTGRRPTSAGKTRGCLERKKKRKFWLCPPKINKKS